MFRVKPVVQINADSGLTQKGEFAMGKVNYKMLFRITKGFDIRNSNFLIKIEFR